MLVAFLSLVALVNLILGFVGGQVGIALSLERILGIAFAPLALAMGVPWKEAMTVGDLLGTRMVLNELIAYSKLGALKASLDPRTFTIATYALCGFANFSSIGIQIGGIGALVPDRRSDLARLGLRALLAGTLANFMTACIAGSAPVSLLPRLDEAVSLIASRTALRPKIGLVLGSGLGAFAKTLERRHRHPLRRDPPLPGVHGHWPHGRAGDRPPGRGARRGDGRPRPLLRGLHPGGGRCFPCACSGDTG